MSFQIGDKVLCIDARWTHDEWFDLGIIHPTEMTCYTVRDLVGNEGILLEEIKNKLFRVISTGTIGEPAWKNFRFIKWNPEEEIESLKEKEQLKVKI